MKDVVRLVKMLEVKIVIVINKEFHGNLYLFNIKSILFL